MKNGRAGGEDDIVIELIKLSNTESLIKEIQQLIASVWSSESMPEDWQSCILFPIHKKGDKRDCKNYRGISLLNVIYKIFSNALYKRMEPIAEEIIGDYQCGFRRNRSTMDQYFTLSQIFEKFYEYSREVHCLIVDFKQAFDSIIRQKIAPTLMNLEIPQKLARLVAMTLRNTSARVLVQGKLTESFETISGVRQGDALSTLVFNLVLHSVLKEVAPGASIATKSAQICAYADDVTIIFSNVQELKNIFLEMELRTNKVGLRVNSDKTKYLAKTKLGRGTRDIAIGDYRFEAVSQFNYLGVTLSSSADAGVAIRERIKMASKCYYARRNLLKSNLLARTVKLKIYKTLIKPVLTYGCEAWTLKNEDCQRIATFERRILRRIFGPIKEEDGSYRSRYNAELEALTNGETVIRFVKSQRLRWLGHLIRMPEDTAVKKIFQLKMFGTRRRGRPRERWLDSVVADLKKMNINNWRSRAKDREGWQKLCCTSFGPHRTVMLWKKKKSSTFAGI